MVKPKTSHMPVEATVYLNKVPVGAYRVVYLGLLGTVIDADADRFSIGADVEVVLRLVGGGDQPACQLAAVVNQHSGLGIGLTFRLPNERGCAALRSMIYESWQFSAAPDRTGKGRRPTAIAWHADRGAMHATR